MKSVLILSTVASVIIQFNKLNIDYFKSNKYKIILCSNFSKGSSMPTNLIREEITKLKSKNIEIVNIPFSRNPLNLFSHIYSYFKLKSLISNFRISLVNTHTPIASALIRLVKFINFKNLKVIYTIHGFHFFKTNNTLIQQIFKFIETVLSKITDLAITINNYDYEIAKKMFYLKLAKTNGIGIQIPNLSPNIPNEPFDSNILRIISIGELNNNKNHISLIKQLINMKNIELNIYGKGINYDRLSKYITKKNLKYVFLRGYSTDILNHIKNSHIFILPSKREGLSVALMEAMSFRKPCIVSNIRGNNELISDGVGGYLVDLKAKNGFRNAITKYLNNKNLLLEHGNQNYLKILDYSNNYVFRQLKEIYDSFLALNNKYESHKTI